ncbi:MAG: response regulator, partial [Desulfobulbus sp.]|nr:response regulator [Desulfobulbus sp.]
IVRQNHGLVLVESSSGLGATFKVFLPAYTAADTHRIEETVPAVGQTGTEATVLLVEDEQCVREIVQAMLEESGYQVLVASTGQEALELCTQDDAKIDLLLTDVIMPGMNGRELSHRIKKMRPELKILFMSGYAADILSEKDSETAMDFLKKPFTVPDLHAAIEQRLTEKAGQ